MLDAGRISQIGVVGAGTMGAGIAQVFLAAGCGVHLHEPDPARLAAGERRIRSGLERWEQKGQIASAEEALGRLSPCLDLERLQGSEWVIEAIVEDLSAKEALFASLGRLCPPETVLASNTSSTSITLLGRAGGRPERTVGMHFFNPPPVMRLVEVISGLGTSEEVIRATCALAERLGKVPVQAKDRPGFVANRVLMPLINEAFWTLEEGVASAEGIDQVAKLGMNHPMGPLELADFIGLDVCLAIMEVLHSQIGDPKFRPCPLLRKYVEAGWLGRKSGRGVYSYES